MSLALRTRKSRVSDRKVKTGCKTCKSRHIKCDETKPSCLRCTTTGRKCDGYATKASTPFVFPSHIGEPAKSLISFGEGTNAHFLELYFHSASASLSGIFKHEFWSKLCLRFAYSEPSVRHALIALTSMFASNSGRMRDARVAFHQPGSSQKTLLLHYNKAIGSLTARMNEVSYTPEIGLTSCLLFVCIEFFRGEYHAAFSHLMSGLRIIAAAAPRGNKGLRISGVTPPEKRNAGVDDVLTSMYAQLITAGLLYGARVENVWTIPEPSMPPTPAVPFEDAEDAVTAMHEIQHVAVKYMTRLENERYCGIERPKLELLRDQSCLIESHRHWLQRVDLTLKQGIAKLPSGTSRDPDTMTMNVMIMAFNLTFVLVSCMLDRNQEQSDNYIPEFQQMLQGCKPILEAIKAGRRMISSNASSSSSSSTPIANFTFTASLIPSLFFVATRCRCPKTRREAIHYLSQPELPREGLWDREQYARLAARAVEIEEAEVDPVTGRPTTRMRLSGAVVLPPTSAERFSVRFTAGKNFPATWLTQRFGVGEGEGQEWEEIFTCD